MDNPVRAPGYDLLKLIVATLLLLLFLILLWRGNSQSPASIPSVPANTANSTSTFATAITPSPIGATTVPSLSATATASPGPSPTASSQPSATSTPIRSATETPTTEPTPTAAGPVSSNACGDATSRSQLQVGMTGTILRRLNFRSSPGIQNNWLLTNRRGTQIEIVGGPVCLPYSVGAYVWWQIQLPDGRVGWSAEASMLGKFYFMEPSQ